MEVGKAALISPAWTTSVDPSGKGLVEEINQALALYQRIGMTKQGAAMLIANFISESGLNPANCEGDGGTACGLGQWRFGRQVGLPVGYEEQLRWAVDTEMIRDSGGHGLKEHLFDPAATPDDIYTGLKEWERWGVPGSRYAIGVALIENIR